MTSPTDQGVGEFVAVCGADDVWDGEMEGFMVGEHQVLLVKLDGRFRAYDGTCPHQAFPLAEGELSDDGIITCRAHQWQFDAASGRSVNPVGQCLRRFPVRVENGQVLVGTRPLGREEETGHDPRGRDAR